MTHYEFTLRCRGAARRAEKTLKRTAWVIASFGNIMGCKPKLTIDKLLKKPVINNDAIAAMIPTKEERERGGRGARSKKEEKEITRDEVNKKKRAFREMMKTKTAEAKRKHQLKLEREKANGKG